jgi:hypothetical protein
LEFFHFQGALALELWSISSQVIFDNFLITDDKAVADKVAAQTWQVKSKQEAASSSVCRLTVYSLDRFF